MNFLGHAFFSPDNSEILAANVFGDFIKGKIENQLFPNNIKAGLFLHRKIDAFCNQCQGYINIKNGIGNNFGHYNAVIADIILDNLLAVYWDDFSDIPLEDFAQISYARIQSAEKYFPGKFPQVFQYMKNDDWFVISRNIDYIERILKNVERRSANGVKIASAVNILNDKPEFLKKHFYVFMNEIRSLLYSSEVLPASHFKPIQQNSI